MSVVAFASGDELTALFALRDNPKPNAARVLELLRRSGFKLEMVTGDSAATARALGPELGFRPGEIHAGVSPEGKLALIAQLQERGEKVAFVGDGINDAPALAQADLGVAMLNASDVAREASGLVLLRPDLEGVAQAMAIARGTLRTIRQNLFWAFFYNAMGVPLAALGFFSPIVSAAAMGLSDLLVVGNALLIERRIPKGFPAGLARGGVRGVGARRQEAVNPQ
jgi:Cu+-exporting ATPase